MPPVPATIYHLVAAAEFDVQAPDEDYRPAQFAEEGFIHATAEPEWVERVAGWVLPPDVGPVYVLEIDTTKVRAKIVMEKAAGHWFPHIFGPLNRDAIRRTGTLDRDAGGFRFPTTWHTT